MPITEELTALGQSVHRLGERSQEIIELVRAIDRILGELMPATELKYLHPRPLMEMAKVSRGGKRVIEVAYLGVMRLDGRHQLVIKQVKILESKAAIASQGGGSVMPLLKAPRAAVFAAVDELGELVRVIREQVDGLAEEAERLRDAARAAHDDFSRPFGIGAGCVQDGD